MAGKYRYDDEDIDRTKEINLKATLGAKAKMDHVMSMDGLIAEPTGMSLKGYKNFHGERLNRE